MEDEKQITSFNEIVEAEEKQVSQSPTSNEPIEQFNIEAVLQEISGLFQELYHANQTLASKLTNTEKNTHDIDGCLRGLSSYIDENGRRTRRLEEGYDFQILKNFARQIIREINGLKIAIDKTADEDKKSIMQDTIDALVELLDRNSIIQITPEAGSLYAGQEKFAECASQKIFIEDNELNGRIASVIREGYQYEFNDGSIRVLEPAKVVLFSTNREQCSEPTSLSDKLGNDIKKKIEKYTKAQRKALWDDEPCIRKKSDNAQNRSCFICSIIIACLCILSVILGVIVFQQHNKIIEFASKTPPINSTNNKTVKPIPSKVSAPVEPKVRPLPDASTYITKPVVPKGTTKANSKSSTAKKQK